MAAILDFSKGHNSVNFKAKNFFLGKLVFHSEGFNEHNCMVIIQMWGGRVLWVSWPRLILDLWTLECRSNGGQTQTKKH